MNEPKICMQCGKQTPADAPEGNCPSCLMALLRHAVGVRLEPLRPQPSGFAMELGSRHFADYELEAEIARGGMGIVYLATQVSLNRPVALKMIASGKLATRPQVERFRLEAEAAAKLNHPHIVPIHEIGVHDGHHFYSMELIEGMSLAESLASRDGRFIGRDGTAPGHEASRRVVALMAKVARAVHHAHRRGILHRDLKPGNILVDSAGEPHVTDFGLAKLLEGDATMTQGIGGMGTPAYMAPEQASESSRQATTAVDIYSLGAVLYELLAGRPPFLADSLPALLRKVAETEPRPLRELNPTIDRDLEVVCLTCLSKDPSARYASAETLADDLEAWAAGRPIRARPPGNLERCWRWCVRQPLLASLGLCTLLLLAVVAIGSPLALLRIEHEKSLAVGKLGESYLSQAKAERRSGQAGQRFDSLDAISRAMASGSRLDPAAARTEVIAALALTDVHWTNIWPHPWDGLVVYSPNLDRYACELPGGEISVNDARTFAPIAKLTTPSGPVLWIGGFSHDSRFLTVYYWNGDISLWDIARGERILTGSRNEGMRAVSVEVRGQFLVARDDMAIQVFTLDPWREIRQIPVGAVYAGINADVGGTRVACGRPGSNDLEVRSLEDGTLLQTLSHPTKLTAVAWSDDASHLAVGCDNGNVFLWTLSDVNSPVRLEAHDEHISALGFSHGGHLLGTVGWDSQIRLWDVESHKRLLSTHGAGAQILFGPGDRQLACAVRDGSAGLFDLAASSTFLRLHAPRSPVRGAWSVAVSPDSTLVAAGGSTGIRFWDLASGHNLLFLQGGNWRGVNFTPDGNHLIASGDTTLEELELRHPPKGSLTAEKPRVIRQDRRLRFEQSALSADGDWVAVANNAGSSMACYSLADPTNRFALTSHDRISYVTLSSNGLWAATGTWKGNEVKVWDLKARSLLRDLPIEGTARALFSPDDRWLVTSSASGYQFWGTFTWTNAPGARCGTELGAMTFSPDATLFASLDAGTAIELREAGSWRLVARLEAPNPAMITALRFSPGGRHLLALEGNAEVQVWNLAQIRGELDARGLDWPTVTADRR